MDKKEFAQFVAALKTYYPRESFLANEQAAELWFAQLRDLPYDVASCALNKWVATNVWSPTIADLRRLAVEVSKGETPDWSAGWAAVLDAARYFGRYQRAEALASLDDLTRRAVERLGWEEICTSEDLTALRANFRMIYEKQAESQSKNAALPGALKEAISKLQFDLIEKKEDAG